MHDKHTFGPSYFVTALILIDDVVNILFWTFIFFKLQLYASPNVNIVGCMIEIDSSSRLIYIDFGFTYNIKQLCLALT